MKKLQLYEDARSSSVFRKSKYNVDLPLYSIDKSILQYIDETQEGFEKLFEIGTPDFQRSRDQWTQKMQISFVENVLMGFKPKIQLYEVADNQDLSNCKILDGLQRLTAWSRFVAGDFEIMNLAFDEMKEHRLITLASHTLQLEIYTFKTIQEVVDFYIKINENITHTNEDIEKARKYLETLK